MAQRARRRQDALQCMWSSLRETRKEATARAEKHPPQNGGKELKVTGWLVPAPRYTLHGRLSTASHSSTFFFFFEFSRQRPSTAKTRVYNLRLEGDIQARFMALQAFWHYRRKRTVYRFPPRIHSLDLRRILFLGRLREICLLACFRQSKNDSPGTGCSGMCGR